MRTAKEIRNYLRQQKWYKEYVRNVKKHPFITKKDKKEILRGYKECFTIIIAFSWEETIQGYEYWKIINKKFNKWYNKKRNEIRK